MSRVVLAERAIYLMAVSPDVTAGVAGLSCGIDYEAAEFAGVDVFGYWICADAASRFRRVAGFQPMPCRRARSADDLEPDQAAPLTALAGFAWRVQPGGLGVRALGA